MPSGERASCPWPDREPFTNYSWYAVADDGGYTNKSDNWSFTTGAGVNHPPNTPYKPSGPQFTKAGVSYTYLPSTTDPDGHQVYYLWDWGDGTHSDWLGPYNSGDMADASHNWNAFGFYQIKVKAKDDPNGDGDLSDGSESVWSTSLLIITPRIKKFNFNLKLLSWLFEGFPNLFPILQKMLQYLGL